MAILTDASERCALFHYNLISDPDHFFQAVRKFMDGEKNAQSVTTFSTISHPF